MDNPESTPPSVEPNSVKSSEFKLLLFFGLALGILAVALISSFLLKDTIREKAGEVMVEVRNENMLELRADLYMGEQSASIDGMDKGDKGTVRFSPKTTGPVLLQLFNNGRLLKTMEEGEFRPGEPAHVRFTVVNSREIRIEYLPVEGSEPP